MSPGISAFSTFRRAWHQCEVPGKFVANTTTHVFCVLVDAAEHADSTIFGLDKLSTSTSTFPRSASRRGSISSIGSRPPMRHLYTFAPSSQSIVAAPAMLCPMPESSITTTFSLETASTVRPLASAAETRGIIAGWFASRGRNASPRKRMESFCAPSSGARRSILQCASEHHRSKPESRSCYLAQDLSNQSIGLAHVQMEFSARACPLPSDAQAAVTVSARVRNIRCGI